MARVTVISVFYNRAYCVRESVRSLIDQTYDDLELLLVDDGSTDDTLAELRSFEGPNIRVLTHENQGFTRSIIRAAAEATGLFIAIHGSGDYSYPERISYQMDFLNNHPDIVAVGCGRRIVYESGRVTTKSFSEVVEIGKLRTRGSNIFSHGEVLFRKDAYEEVGGYRSVFTYAQDYDLWLRLNDRYRVANLDRVLYREYSRTDGVRNNVDKVILQKKFAELAKLGAIRRAAGAPDPVVNSREDDLFATLGESSITSKRFLRLSIESLAAGRRELAYRSLDEVRNYPGGCRTRLVEWSLRTVAAWVLLRSGGVLYQKLRGTFGG